MSLIKNLLFLFAILISSTTIFAQESSSDIPAEPTDSSDVTSLSPDHYSSEPVPMSAATGTFSHFSFKPPQFDFNWPQIPDFFSGGSRQKRSPAEPQDAEHARQDAAFFRRVIRCNFLTEGGSKCTSCNTVRRCYLFNFGTVSTCSGTFAYCNNGQCSKTKGPLCRTTTTTTSTSSTTDASTSTSSDSSSSSSDSSSTSSSSSSSSSGSSKSSDSSSSSSSSGTTS